jgi:hypothetical protein
MALASTGCAPSIIDNGPGDIAGGLQYYGSDVDQLSGEVGPDESNIEELSGEVDICEPTSAPDSVDLTGNDLSGAAKEPEPDYIELSGDVAYPDGYDSTGSEDIMVTTEGEVAWPEA